MGTIVRIKRRQDWLLGLVMACGFVALLSACSGNKDQTEAPSAPKAVSQQPAASPPPLPKETRTTPAAAGGSCAAMLTDKCTACHSSTRVCDKLGKKSKSRWQRTIDRMIERGAQLNSDEAAALLVCLDNGANNDLQTLCR
jgi:hypothetical protein